MDIKEFLEPEEIYERYFSRAELWPYKTRREFYRIRDFALLAVTYYTGARIGEVILLERKQFDMKSAWPEFIVIKNFEISKRKKALLAMGRPKIEIPLATTGRMSIFTSYIEDYLRILEREVLFPFDRTRAYSIIKTMTGKWPHYFRAQRLSYMMNLFRSESIVSELMGIENSRTIKQYYTTEWKQHKEDLKK